MPDRERQGGGGGSLTNAETGSDIGTIGSGTTGDQQGGTGGGSTTSIGEGHAGTTGAAGEISRDRDPMRVTGDESVTGGTPLTGARGDAGDLREPSPDALPEARIGGHSPADGSGFEGRMGRGPGLGGAAGLGRPGGDVGGALGLAPHDEENDEGDEA